MLRIKHFGQSNCFKNVQPSLSTSSLANCTTPGCDITTTIKLESSGILKASGCLSSFKRVFDSYTKGQDVGTEVAGGANEVQKTIVEDVQGNVTETTYKTNTINNAGGVNGQNVVIGQIDNSTKDMSVKTAKTENAYQNLNTGIDSYFDRDNYNQAFG